MSKEKHKEILKRIEERLKKRIKFKIDNIRVQTTRRKLIKISELNWVLKEISKIFKEEGGLE